MKGIPVTGQPLVYVDRSIPPTNEATVNHWAIVATSVALIIIAGFAAYYLTSEGFIMLEQAELAGSVSGEFGAYAMIYGGIALSVVAVGNFTMGVYHLEGERVGRKTLVMQVAASLIGPIVAFPFIIAFAAFAAAGCQGNNNSSDCNSLVLCCDCFVTGLECADTTSRLARIEQAHVDDGKAVNGDESD